MTKLSVIAAVTLTTALGANLFASTLDEVVVTSKSNQSIADTAGATIVITQEDIKRSNATSIQDILVEQAGIVPSVNSSSISGRQTISIRGTSSKHVLILVDGKKVSGSDAQIGHSDFQYNWVPMNNIEKIEVIKGPMSSIYGSQAIGGVVNIITKKTKQKFFGDVDFVMGFSSDTGGDSKAISANIGGQITDNLSVIVSAEKSELEAVEDEESSTTTQIEGKDLLNGSIRLQYDIDDSQEITASFLAGEEDRWKVNDVLYYDIEKQNYSFGYEKRFEDITLGLEYYVTDSDLHYNTTSSTGGYTHNMTDTVAKAETKIASFENHFIVTGIETKNEEYDKVYDKAASSGNNFKNDLTNNSIFIQDEIEIGESFILTLGTRYDDHEKFGGEWSPRANIVYKINENHRLKAGYGEGFNAPTVTQNSSSYTSTSRHIFHGNDDLKAETSRSYEIGYEYLGEGFSFKTALFETKVDDLISTEKTVDNPGFAPDEYQYVNVDKAKMRGLELEADYDINQDHNIKVSYNYLNTEDEATGEDLSYKPKNSFNVRLASQLPEGFVSSVSANYVGTQTDGTDEFGSYTTMNFQISKAVSKNLSVRFGMDNVGDKNLNNTPYDLKGRFTYLGFNYKF